jgi:hypothetical protein
VPKAALSLEKGLSVNEAATTRWWRTGFLAGSSTFYVVERTFGFMGHNDIPTMHMLGLLTTRMNRG